MAKIKQIKVYSQSNSSWKTGDIGADASNIDLASAVGNYTNVEDAIQYINNNKISKISGFEGAGSNNEVSEFLINTNTIGYRVKADDFDDTISSPSSEKYQDVFQILDTNDHMIGFLEQYQETSGTIGLGFATRKYVNDDYVSNYLFANIANNGTLSYTVANPSAFRSAIGAQQTLTASSNITLSGATISAKDTTYAVGTSATAGLVPTGGTNGQVLKRNSTGGLTWSTDLNTTYTAASLGAATTAAVNAAQTTANHAKTIADAINTTHVFANGSAKNVATATDTILISTTLNKGNWEVSIWARFANNSTGRRAIHISTGSNSTTRLDVNAGITLAPCSGGYAELSMNHFINCTGNTVVNLCCYQASGSTLSCQGRIQAKKLGTL